MYGALLVNHSKNLLDITIVSTPSGGYTWYVIQIGSFKTVIPTHLHQVLRYGMEMECSFKNVCMRENDAIMAYSLEAQLVQN